MDSRSTPITGALAAWPLSALLVLSASPLGARDGGRAPAVAAGETYLFVDDDAPAAGAPTDPQGPRARDRLAWSGRANRPRSAVAVPRPGGQGQSSGGAAGPPVLPILP